MESKLVSIKQASKQFKFPLQKLYQLVDDNEVPHVKIENLSGSTSNRINTRVFAEWLDDLARENKTI